MSVDWFLWSKSHQRSAMIGSVGLGGVQSFPAHPDVIEFVRWVIDNHVPDVVMCDEYRRDAESEDDGA
jgi:hypothetical protein